MGISMPIDEYEREILLLLNISYAGLKWCELGNQRTWDNKPAKSVYAARGVEHTSIDINGQDGALKLDLEKPLPENLVGKFDVISNYGTAEHINDQYSAFLNIGKLCRKEGVMIHMLPLVGNWPGHCRYYYTQEFAKSLSELCGYELVDSRILDKSVHKHPRTLLAVAFKKGKKEFPSKEEFMRIRGIEDSGDTTWTGDYSTGARRFLMRVLRALKKK